MFSLKRLGGEPLLRPERLYPVLEAARDNGIGILFYEPAIGVCLSVFLPMDSIQVIIYNLADAFLLF